MPITCLAMDFCYLGFQRQWFRHCEDMFNWMKEEKLSDQLKEVTFVVDKQCGKQEIKALKMLDSSITSVQRRTLLRRAGTDERLYLFPDWTWYRRQPDFDWSKGDENWQQLSRDRQYQVPALLADLPEGDYYIEFLW